MERIREKCIDFFSSEDVKKNIIQPTVEYLYNETYLYIWIFVTYQIFFISILITILIILVKIFNSFHNKYSDIEKNNIN
jgi:hypothetical protein